MLPKDIPGLSVPRESIDLSRWAPFVQLRPAPAGPGEAAPAAVSLAEARPADGRAAAVLRRAA